ncbi:MAG: MFS transporter, partial [Candidatus Nanopelagicales bacterium]
ERQPTAASVAGAFAVLFLPYSLVGPFAGVFLDEWRRRQVLVYANLLRGLLVVGVAALVGIRHDGLDLAVSVLLVLGVARFFLAGVAASLPHVVDGPPLAPATARPPPAGTSAAASGGLVGVGIRAVSGGGDTGSIVVLACAIASYIISAAIAATLPKDRLGPDEDTVRNSLLGVIQGFGDGFRQLVQHPLAGRAVVVVIVQRIAFGALTVLGLLLIRNTFNPAADADAALGQFALVTGAAAVGALLGAIATPGRVRRMGYVRWTVIAVGQAAPVVTVGVLGGMFLPALWPLLIAALSLGFANQAAKVASDTLIQREIDDDYLGRVFSLFDVAVNVALVAGIVAVAFTSPESGIAPITVLIVGALIAVNAAWYRGRGAKAHG